MDSSWDRRKILRWSIGVLELKTGTFDRLFTLGVRAIGDLEKQPAESLLHEGLITGMQYEEVVTNLYRFLERLQGIPIVRQRVESTTIHQHELFPFR